MITKDNEYSALKQEIISTTEIITNSIIAMYTIGLSIFVFASEFGEEWMLLAPYIVLFPFQNLINRKRDGINRLSAYISVFLEEEEGWENNYKNYSEVFRNSDKRLIRKRKIVNFLIGRTSSTQLGLLSTLFFNIMFWQEHRLNFENIWLPFLSIVLLGLIAYMNQPAFSNLEMREDHIEKLKIYKEKGLKDMTSPKDNSEKKKKIKPISGSKKDIGIIIVIYIVILVLIPVGFGIITNNVKLTYELWNNKWIGFLGSYLGGALGGLGTLIVLAIMVKKDCDVQLENKMDTDHKTM